MRCAGVWCRHFADDLRGTQARASTFAEPEWKEKALGKAVMFGYQVHTQINVLLVFTLTLTPACLKCVHTGSEH